MTTEIALVYPLAFIKKAAEDARKGKKTYPVSRFFTNPATFGMLGGLSGAALGMGAGSLFKMTPLARLASIVGGATAGSHLGYGASALSRLISAKARQGDIPLEIIRWINPISAIMQDRSFEGRKAMGGKALFEFEKEKA